LILTAVLEQHVWNSYNKNKQMLHTDIPPGIFILLPLKH